MKRFHFLLAAAAMLAFAPLTQAASVTAKLSWINPTQGCTTNADGTLKGGVCDNVPLTGDSALTEIQVFVDTKAIVPATLPTPVKLGVVTGNDVTKTVSAGDTLYYRLKACNGPTDKRVCSDLSAQVSKAVPTLPDVKPGVPSSLSIAITVASLSSAEFDALLAKQNGVMTPDDTPQSALF